MPEQAAQTTQIGQNRIKKNKKKELCTKELYKSHNQRKE